MFNVSNRADLIAVSESEYQHLASRLSQVDENLAQKPFADGISIKDTIASLNHWVVLFLGRYKRGQSEGATEIPVKGFQWNQLKGYNTNLRTVQAGLSWEKVLAMLAASHAALMRFLKGKTDTELYGTPVEHDEVQWTTGRWVEEAGARHYRQAAEFVQSCLCAAPDREK